MTIEELKGLNELLSKHSKASIAAKKAKTKHTNEKSDYFKRDKLLLAAEKARKKELTAAKKVINLVKKIAKEETKIMKSNKQK